MGLQVTRHQARDRVAVLVDDGIATGATMRAAVLATRGVNPARLIVAAPVAPAEVLGRFAGISDAVVVLATPEPFGAVGACYAFFDQTTDEEVIDLLVKASREAALGGRERG